MAGGVIGRLRAILGLDPKPFERGLDRSKMKTRDFFKSIGMDADRAARMASGRLAGIGTAFVGGLAGGLVTTALSGFNGNLGQTVKNIAAIGDEAKRAGIGVEEFQQWKFVAEQNRIGIDQFIDGLKEMSLRADEFVTTGGGAASEAFGRLGLSAERVAGMMKDPSDMMLQLIGRLGQLDKAAQIRVADELFGGSGGERFVELIGLGEVGIMRMKSQAQQLGLVMDREMIAKAAELDRKFAEVGARITAMWQNAVVSAAETFDEWSNVDLDNVFDSQAQAAQRLGVELEAAMRANNDLVDENLAAATQIKGAWDRAALAVGNVAAELRPVGQELNRLGFRDAALEMSALYQEAIKLTDQMEDGTIGTEEFESRVSDLAARAQEALAEANKIDGVDFSNAISAAATLTSVIAAMRDRANEAAAALARAAGLASEDAGPVYSGRGSDRAGMAEMRARQDKAAEDARSPLAPRTSPRPRLPGVDSLGDFIAAGAGAGGGGGGGGGGAADGYADMTAEIRAETAALEAQAVALLAVAGSGADYGDALEYARKRAELLVEAQKAGKAITPELRAEVDALAQAYVTASLSVEEAEEKLERIREAGERGVDAFTDIFMALVGGAGDAKQALASLFIEMAKVQAQKAFLGMSGQGGIFGRLFGGVGNLLTVGANANGTRSWSGGLTMLGERGRELVDLPRGSRVYSNIDTERMMGAQGRAPAANIQVQAVPNPYFDLRVGQIATSADARMAQAQQSALPAQIRNMQQRGTN